MAKKNIVGNNNTNNEKITSTIVKVNGEDKIKIVIGEEERYFSI